MSAQVPRFACALQSFGFTCDVCMCTGFKREFKRTLAGMASLSRRTPFISCVFVPDSVFFKGGEVFKMLCYFKTRLRVLPTALLLFIGLIAVVGTGRVPVLCMCCM